MKQSDYFKSILDNQRNRNKIYKNSHCDKCLGYDNLSMIRSNDKVTVLCENCARQRRVNDTMNISFKQLSGNVTDNYTKTLKGWSNKTIKFEDLHKIVSKSNIQYSPYQWKNGHKIPNNFDRSKQTHITIDVDDGLSIDRFKEIMKKYQYCLSTTKSHQKDKKGIVCDRFRCTIKATNISSDDDIYFRAIKLVFPFNDVQTLTKTSSFLGCDDCIVIYNKGIAIDLSEANVLAKKQLYEEKEAIIKIDKDLLPNRQYNQLDDVKDSLNIDIVKLIAESIGIEFEGYKCSLRDERTKSCKLYPSLMFKDFGGEFKGDIFKLLMDRENMSFKEAIAYVNNFI